MDTHDLDALLRPTLDDRRLSRGEKQALREVFAALDLGRDGALVRSRAFEAARAALDRPEDREVVGWLEDVVNLLIRTHESAPAPHDLAEAWFAPGDDCAGRIARMFASARHAVDVCVFTITDDRIADALLDAHRRGVAVRIVTDNEKAEDLGSDIDRLARAGVAVRVDRSEYHMHHKFALFDGATLLTGSYNWTRGASSCNDENFVLTTDPRLVAPFARTFERLWAKFG